MSHQTSIKKWVFRVPGLYLLEQIWLLVEFPCCQFSRFESRTNKSWRYHWMDGGNKDLKTGCFWKDDFCLGWCTEKKAWDFLILLSCLFWMKDSGYPRSPNLWTLTIQTRGMWTAPRANTAFAVQGMASSFDTHGHFAVLLGLSFRRWRTHGGLWWILGTLSIVGNLGGIFVSLA